MAFANTKFKLKKWGPKKLREIFEAIEIGINERTPLPSVTIDVSQKPDGREIIVKSKNSGADDAGGSGGSGGGTSIALYGARNGAAAVFHLLQSSAPTAP